MVANTWGMRSIHKCINVQLPVRCKALEKKVQLINGSPCQFPFLSVFPLFAEALDAQIESRHRRKIENKTHHQAEWQIAARHLLLPISNGDNEKHFFSQANVLFLSLIWCARYVELKASFAHTGEKLKSNWYLKIVNFFLLSHFNKSQSADCARLTFKMFEIIFKLLWEKNSLENSWRKVKKTFYYVE